MKALTKDITSITNNLSNKGFKINISVNRASGVFVSFYKSNFNYLEISSEFSKVFKLLKNKSIYLNQINYKFEGDAENYHDFSNKPENKREAWESPSDYYHEFLNHIGKESNFNHYIKFRLR